MTTTLQSPSANRDQAALWNDAAGRNWAELQSMLDGMLAPFAEHLMAEGFPGEGKAVLDVGCGAGATTLAMARRLGPDGLALGVDISGPLVETARTRAEAEGLGSAGFVQADAQTYRFDAEMFDAVISRFGVMFFDDPPAAFANLRRATRRGGTLRFVAWRSPADNPFMVTAARAAAPFLPALPRPAPDAPGQFAFADEARVRAILDAAGWSNVSVRPLDLPTVVPEADLMTYVTRMGPVGLALPTMDPATRGQVTEALRAAFAPFIQGGSAQFTSACWSVTAQA